MIQKEPFYLVKTKLKVILSNLFQALYSEKRLLSCFQLPSQYLFTINLHRLFSQRGGSRI
jgi:hypothetical protein